ncbi:Protein-glutamate O-methyltransferase [Lentibacillus sp. JNUCC-1]|uniref:CheR family methyltransferase n=1 Tax=Lentibacillus sp. JNUCC-1 TaxID=2654513 RepID=UPI001326EE46|nr:Protein-glutamate O-methyltransferase [Lentibacillus sp. JNUCC-1]
MTEEYTAFMSRIKKKLDIDLSLYKEAQMKRRLTSLRDKRGFTSFDLYYKALDREEELLHEFMDRITINVSSFFRNPNRWDVLEKKVLPELLKERKHLNIWSAACSTGEEPYSLAMVLNKHFPGITAHILATDIDDNILHKAETGLYTKQAITGVPTDMQRLYFTETNGNYRVQDQLRDMITFKRHNLLKDSYPKQLDLILCRNVLIYFTDTAKEHIYNKFSQSMTQGGTLFVGSTEQIFTPEKYDMHLLDTFFYQKNT